MSGLLILVSAPSGAGKTSLVQALLEADSRLAVSVSHTTRPRRPAETDGENYHFVDDATFQNMIGAEQFLEHALVFGNRYGTAKTTVEALRDANRDVILEIDWQGAEQVRALQPDAISIFVLPPSLDTLAERLTNRGQDEADVIERRLAQAMSDMARCVSYDYLVINDTFDEAVADLQAILRAEQHRTATVAQREPALLDALTGGE